MNYAEEYQQLLKSIVSAPIDGKKETILMLVDQQRMFCDPEHPNHYGTEETVKVALSNEKLITEFRKAAVPVYSVYAAKNEFSCPEFFHYKPEGNDRVLVKDIMKTSAFEESYMAGMLEKNGVKNILVCGFNLASCAKKTAIDGVNTGKFKVYFMEDMVANNNQCDGEESLTKSEYMLREAGVRIISAKKLLANVGNFKNNRPLV